MRAVRAKKKSLEFKNGHATGLIQSFPGPIWPRHPPARNQTRGQIVTKAPTQIQTFIGGRGHFGLKLIKAWPKWPLVATKKSPETLIPGAPPPPNDAMMGAGPGEARGNLLDAHDKSCFSIDPRKLAAMPYIFMRALCTSTAAGHHIAGYVGLCRYDEADASEAETSAIPRRTGRWGICFLLESLCLVPVPGFLFPHAHVIQTDPLAT